MAGSSCVIPIYFNQFLKTTTNAIRKTQKKTLDIRTDVKFVVPVCDYAEFLQ
jgi:hypothetical protein